MGLWRRFVQMIREQLTQGATPAGLARSCAFGVIIGCCPLFGLTTLMGIAVAVRLKLNHVTLQAVNYAMAAPQLILMPLFLRVGELLTLADPMPLNPLVLFPEFYESPTAFFTKYWAAALYALMGWALFAPIAAFVVYRLTKPIFIRLHAEIHKR